jgi:hypothetical protein
MVPANFGVFKMNPLLKKVIRGSWTAELRERRSPYTGEMLPYVVAYLTKSGSGADYPIRYDDGRIAYDDWAPSRDKRRAVEAVMPAAM